MKKSEASILLMMNLHWSYLFSSSMFWSVFQSSSFSFLLLLLELSSGPCLGGSLHTVCVSYPLFSPRPCELGCVLVFLPCLLLLFAGYGDGDPEPFYALTLTLTLKLTVSKAAQQEQKNVLTLQQAVLILMVKSEKWWSLWWSHRHIQSFALPHWYRHFHPF